MNNTDLIKELRALTSAGMKDCKEALEEANWDLQKAVDIVKIKGLNIADGRTGRVASEGKVGLLISDEHDAACMVEINCQTDFVANSDDFKNFAADVIVKLAEATSNNPPFDVSSVEDGRKAVVSKTKENVVVRRWWVEEPQSPLVKVFGYQHSNHKIAVMITMLAPNESAANNPEFKALGEDLAMQICAMNPLAVSQDRISAEDHARQVAIFETQLQEEKKPAAMWSKIIEGKSRKWFTEVCLLEQESVVVPKTTVKQVVKNVGSKLGGEISVVSFIRCQVGEGIEQKKDDLAQEVAKLTGEDKHSSVEAKTENNTDQSLIEHVASKLKV